MVLETITPGREIEVFQHRKFSIDGQDEPLQIRSWQLKADAADAIAVPQC